jgi:GxxExxY protein
MLREEKNDCHRWGPMDADEEKLNEMTEKIIGCAFEVHNTLGPGFAERVYENALVLELKKLGLAVQQQVPLAVRYKGALVGDYTADLIVEKVVMVENKAVRNFDDGHSAQCINYLACTALPICLLLNFGKKVEVKRFRGVAGPI